MRARWLAGRIAEGLGDAVVAPVMAYVPDAHLVAVADAPPTIEAALKFALEKGAIFYPFTDLLLPDPYAVMTDKVLHAFYIGPSGAVGGVRTEAVAWATNDVFIQMWVGTEELAALPDIPENVRTIAMFVLEQARSAWEPVPLSRF